MKKLIVTRGVESPLFPGLTVDKIAFTDRYCDFCVDPNETNKLLKEYGYEIEKINVDESEEWRKI